MSFSESFSDDIIRTLREVKRFSSVLLLFVPVIYFLSGFYSVGQNERGVVTRLGKVVEDDVVPGMHYHLPWPLEKVEKIPAASLQSLMIEFGDENNKTIATELVTGDHELVDLAFEVQFTVSQTSVNFYSTQAPNRVLEKLAASQAIAYVGANTFEGLITTGRNRFQSELKLGLQELLNEFALGIRVTSVQIGRLDPPKTLKKSFDDVSTARSEKQKFIQEARGETAAQFAKARSEANKTRLNIQASADELIKQAEGDHQRLMSLIDAYEASPDITHYRYYLESLERILAKTQLTLVD